MISQFCLRTCLLKVCNKTAIISFTQNLSHTFPDILFHKYSKEKRIKLRIKVKKENNNGLCCQTEGAAAVPAWLGCIPKPAIINGLTSTEEKKGRPESAGQKKSQQTKKKQIKSTIIKHRCYKENKLHKIYWVLTKLDICGKDIRSRSQVRPGRAGLGSLCFALASSSQPRAGDPAATPPALQLHGTVAPHYPRTFATAMLSY